jgi:hypothetical protein
MPPVPKRRATVARVPLPWRPAALQQRRQSAHAAASVDDTWQGADHDDDEDEVEVLVAMDELAETEALEEQEPGDVQTPQDQELKEEPEDLQAPEDQELEEEPDLQAVKDQGLEEEPDLQAVEDQGLEE